MIKQKTFWAVYCDACGNYVERFYSECEAQEYHDSEDSNGKVLCVGCGLAPKNEVGRRWSEKEVGE